MRDPSQTPPSSAAAEPGARRSLRALLRGGPFGQAIARADLRLYRLIRSAARPPALEPIGRFSRLGEHAAVWVALGLVGMAVDRPRRRRWGRALASVVGTYLLNTAIKGVFRRARPALDDLPALIATPTALSFPSAHASSSFAAARAYSALLPGRAAVRDRRGDGAVAGLPRRALPDRHRGGRAARHDRRERGAMKVGIVGMPNAGKSSLFNALTRAGAEAANYPFTTIEPNIAVVPVADERLDAVAETMGASSIVPDTIDFHDIAGLVAGASKGEGLGNQFLANIRETDAIVHVVRAHHDANVIHPEGDVDPMRDIETIETELIYADLEQAERRLDRVVRQARGGDRAAIAEERWLRAVDRRAAGRAARPGPCRSPEDAPGRAAQPRTR